MADLTRRQALLGSATLVAAAGLPVSAAVAAGHAKSEAGTQTKRKLKVVVAGGHPDDPESGCGGTIALYADAGHEVVNVYLTRGEAGIVNTRHEDAARIRTAEAEEACKILGARPLFAGQTDGATEITAARYDDVYDILVDVKADIVITHWPIDTHRDHRVTSLLVYDAWLRMGRRFELYYFEVLTGEQSQLFAPTHYVDISSVEPRKRQACYAHKSQGAEHGFYPDHEMMHKFRGREAGVERAEAFVRHSQKPEGLL